MARVCAKPGCPELTTAGYCKSHREPDRRPSAHRRGYNRKWREARGQYLKANPWCVMCAKEGRKTPATEVDHIERHMGDMRKFWNRKNWQQLCKSHHSAKTWSEVHGRPIKRKGCDANGFPIDWSSQWEQA